MLYYNNKWYDNKEEITITSQDKLFTVFSNGKKRMTFEVNQQITNYNESLVIQFQAKQEFNRRFQKW
jgi:membrane-bound lytic murein transglycosylase MltF